MILTVLLTSLILAISSDNHLSPIEFYSKINISNQIYYSYSTFDQDAECFPAKIDQSTIFLPLESIEWSIYSNKSNLTAYGGYLISYSDYPVSIDTHSKLEFKFYDSYSQLVTQATSISYGSQFDYLFDDLSDEKAMNCCSVGSCLSYSSSIFGPLSTTTTDYTSLTTGEILTTTHEFSNTTETTQGTTSSGDVPITPGEIVIIEPNQVVTIKIVNGIIYKGIISSFGNQYLTVVENNVKILFTSSYTFEPFDF